MENIEMLSNFDTFSTLVLSTTMQNFGEISDHFLWYWGEKFSKTFPEIFNKLPIYYFKRAFGMNLLASNIRQSRQFLYIFWKLFKYVIEKISAHLDSIYLNYGVKKLAPLITMQAGNS